MNWKLTKEDCEGNPQFRIKDEASVFLVEFLPESQIQINARIENDNSTLTLCNIQLDKENNITTIPQAEIKLIYRDKTITNSAYDCATKAYEGNQPLKLKQKFTLKNWENIFSNSIEKISQGVKAAEENLEISHDEKNLLLTVLEKFPKSFIEHNKAMPDTSPIEYTIRGKIRGAAYFYRLLFKTDKGNPKIIFFNGEGDWFGFNAGKHLPSGTGKAAPNADAPRTENNITTEEIANGCNLIQKIFKIDSFLPESDFGHYLEVAKKLANDIDKRHESRELLQNAKIILLNEPLLGKYNQKT